VFITSSLIIKLITKPRGLQNPEWVVLGRSGPHWPGTQTGADESQRKMSWAENFFSAEFDKNRIVGCRQIPFKINQSFWVQISKIQILLDWKLNWGQTKINLKKLFKDFSNLELFKISLNIQIQTKTLNKGFLKWFRKKILK
jgi:hypothetical protein